MMNQQHQQQRADSPIDDNLYNAHQCIQAAIVYLTVEYSRFDYSTCPPDLSAALQCARDCGSAMMAYDQKYYDGGQCGHAMASVESTRKLEVCKSYKHRRETNIARDSMRVTTVTPCPKKQRSEKPDRRHRQHHHQTNQQPQPKPHPQPQPQPQTQPQLIFYGGRVMSAGDEATQQQQVEETEPSSPQPVAPPPTPATKFELVIPIHSHPKTVLGVMASMVPSVAVEAQRVAEGLQRVRQEDEDRLAAHDERVRELELTSVTSPQLDVWRGNAAAVATAAPAPATLPPPADSSADVVAGPWEYRDPFEAECAAQLAQFACMSPFANQDASMASCDLTTDWGSAVTDMDSAEYL